MGHHIFGRRLKSLVLLSVFTLYSLSAFANSSHDWLVAQQGTDGAVVSNSLLSDSAQSTYESVVALSSETIYSAQIDKAADHLNILENYSTELLSRVILANSLLGRDNVELENLLLLNQNIDGGFGSYPSYESDPLSTAFALRALTGSTHTTSIGKSVSYLLSKQNAGWKLDGVSSVALTSEVILSLSNHLRFQGVSSSLSTARNFLQTQKRSDQLWGQTFESALAISALSTGANSSAELSPSVQSLMTRVSNANWHNDVYSTALALQAIRRVNSIGSATFDKGAIKGQVLLAGTNQPLAGVNVSLENTLSKTTTDIQGYFSFANVPTGAQTVMLTKSGFTTSTGATIVRSATISNLGQLVLGQESTTGLVNGKLISSQTLEAISGARITITGSTQVSAVSSASGQFEFNNLPVGAYSFTIDAVGYRSLVGSFTIQAGRNLQINQALVSVEAPLVSGPGVLSGKVIDSSTGLPLVAQILIDGVPISANAAGEFTSPPVLRGNHELEVMASGYQSASYQINFPEGASGNIGTLGLYKSTQQNAPVTLTLLAQVVDGVSGRPVSAATINLPSGSILTDANGQASIQGLTSLNLDLQVSATGYIQQQATLTATAFGSVAARFELQPEVEAADAWSVGGVLRDESTQIPIANASISTGVVSVQTDSNGRYLIENLSDSQLALTLSAEGYNTAVRGIQLGQTKGAYTVDLTLSALPSDANSNLRVLLVDLPAQVEPDSLVMINLDVDNSGNEIESALVFVKVLNQDGEEVDSLLPYLPNSEIASPHIDFVANDNTVLQVPWNVKQTAEGDYTLRAEIVALASIARELPRGKIIASGFADTRVNGVAIFSGALNIDPPISQAGSVVPVKLAGLLRNTGNKMLDAGALELTITNKNTGEVYHTASSTMNSIQQNEVAEIDFGLWTPATTQIGELIVKVVRADGVKGEINNSLYIGDVAQAHYTIDENVLPEGDSALKGKIQLTGVDAALNSSVDPLFSLVKKSVENGAAYTAPSAVNWDKANRCLGCHIQAQSLAGVGSALNKANIDPVPAMYLLNAMTTAIRSNGSLETSHTMHTKTATLFGAWALTEWPDQQQVFRTQIKALEQLWRTRSTASGSVFWTQDHDSGWLNNSVTATAMSALIASRTLTAENSLTAPHVDYSWGNVLTVTPGYGSDQAMKSSGEFIYVAYPGGRVEKVNPTLATSQNLFPEITGVSGRINGLDIDRDGNFWMTTEQGRLIKTSASGQVLKNIAVCGSQTGGALIDQSSEHVYVICHREHLLRKFTIATETLSTLVTGGMLNWPYGLAWAKDGSLLIANYNAANILKYNIGSSTLSLFSDGMKALPINIAVDDQENLFVTVNGGDQTEIGVNRIRPDGTAERVLWRNGAFGAVNHAGKIFIGDRSYKTLYPVNETPLNVDVLLNFKNAMPLIAQYLLNNSTLSQANNNLQSSALMGLAEARKHLPEGTLRDQVDARIIAIADVLKQRQAPGGGWSVNGVATNTTRDPLMTALVGIALEYTSPSSQDPMVRNAITYLLNTQKANGSWHASTYFTTDLGTTSLIMVYMPKALDRLGGLDVKLSMTQPDNVLLSNASVAPSATQIGANGSVSYEWDLKGVTGNGLDLTFDLAVKNLTLNEERSVSSSVNLSFANSFTDEIITTDISIPKVKTVVTQSLDLQTDKLSYLANEPVQINNVIRDLGSGFVGGKVGISIRAAGATDSIAQLNPVTVDAIAQGQAQTASTQWNTANQLAGHYEIVSQLFDSQNRVIAEDSQSIQILPTAQGDLALLAKVFTDKPVYQQTDIVKIDASAVNQLQNDFVQPALGKLAVTDSQGAVVLTQEFAIQQLVKGARFNQQVPLSTSGFELGQYQVVWSVYESNGQTLLSSSAANFLVETDPLFNLVGDVTIEQDAIEKGSIQTCHFNVTNQQGELPNLQVNRRLVAVESNVIVQTDSNLISLGAATQSYQSLYATNPLELGVYACVLEVVIGNSTRVLDTALFELKEAPIRLTGDLVLGGKPRLLVLMDESLTEKTYLDQLLMNNGWFYSIVKNANDFKTEMQTGGYGAYALLSEKITLTPETRNLLKSKVAAGDGLVVANGHDRRHQSLEEVLGVRVHAKQTKIKGVRANSVLLGNWSHDFIQSINAMTFDLKGATLAGQYSFSTAPADQPKALGVASEFNVFALNDYTSLSSTIEGRLAVGGNLNLQHFSVGDKLSANPLQDVVLVGGNVTFPSGKIYNGNLVAAGSVAGVGDAVRFGMAAGAVIRGNASTGIDVESEREWLQDLSASLSSIPTNGKTKMKWGGLELTGDCSSSQQVFSVNAADLAVAHTFAVSCIPSGATVIFNVPGQNVTIQNMGMQSLTNIRDKVIFNFPQATSLTFKSVAIEGSVLAPYAKVDQPAGRIEGQVVVKSWNSTNWGYMSIHNRRFSGDLSAHTKPKTDNAMATYQYQQGKTVFVSFDLLAQAVALSGNVNPFEETLLAALNAIVPVDIHAGKFIALNLVAENTGSKATAVTAVLSLPLPVELAAQNDFSPVPNTQDWTLTFMSEPGAIFTRQVYVRLPEASSAVLLFKLQTSSGNEAVIRFEKSLIFSAQ